MPLGGRPLSSAPRRHAALCRSIDQFVVAKKLGGGYASTVHLAICKATGLQVAIKVYHRCKLSQLNNYQVQREIRIHSCLDHKNVLQLVSGATRRGGTAAAVQPCRAGRARSPRRQLPRRQAAAMRAVL